MKPLLVIGWILLALEALFVVMQAVTKNVGDDAAGRGMAGGFAIVLAPIVLVAAGLFYWGSRGGPVLAASKPDWSARDHRDQTILGHAVVKAANDYDGTTRVEAVRLLPEAGAPAQTNIIAPVRTQGSVSEHDVV